MGSDLLVRLRKPSKKRGTMTSHKTASLMFGLAVLLYSSESLTAADEK
jgi:hypothetical protein